MITPIGMGDEDWSLKDILEAQQHDTFCAAMAHYLEEGTLPDTIMHRLVEEESDFEEEDEQPTTATLAPKVKQGWQNWC